jgi:hypothetical protein
MRELEALSIKVSGCRRGEFFRASSGKLETAQERRGGWRCGSDQSATLRSRKEHRCLHLVIVRQSLQAPRRWIPDVTEPVRAIEAGRDRTHQSIDGPWQPAGPETIAPLEEIVLRRVLELHSR